MTPANVALYNWINRAFVFKGRAARSDYWWPRLLVTFVNLVLGTLFLEGGGEAWFTLLIDLSEQASAGATVTPDDLNFPPLTSMGTFALTASLVFAALTFFPMLSLSWRRFQDLGRPGWMHLIVLLFVMLAYPLGQLVLFAEFIIFAFPGKKEPNRYGPDPVKR